MAIEQGSGHMKMTAPLELGITTNNIDLMIKFYIEVLGLKLIADNYVPPENSLRTGATPHGYRIVRLQTPYGERIKLVQTGSPSPQIGPFPYAFERQGFAYITFVVADLDDVIKRLKQHEVNLLGEGKKVEVRPGVFVIFSIDPEGNYIEFVEYTDIASYRPDLYR